MTSCRSLAAPFTAVILALGTLHAAAPVTFTFKKQSDWGQGMVAEVTLKNTGGDDVKDWRVRFRFASEIQGLWGAKILEHKNQTYLLGPEEWSRQIRRNGGSVVFGFQSTPGGLAGPEQVFFQPMIAGGRPAGVPERSEENGIVIKPLFAGAPDVKAALPGGAEIDFRVVTDWGSGFQAEVIVRNKTSEPIRNWTLQLSMPRRITGMWNAHIASISGDTFLIDAATQPWNRDIPAGGEVRFGFIGAPGDVAGPPGNLALVGSPGTSQPVEVSATPGGPPFTLPPPDMTPPSITPRLPTYAQALDASLLFYEAQRSGPLPANNRVAWRGNSAMQDGSDVGVDLTGGYFDAGDGVKFAFPMAGAMTLLAWGGIEFPEGYRRGGQLEVLRETVRWGTDWLMKADAAPEVFFAQVGRGDLDHSFWGPPERMDMPRPAFRIDKENPGSDLAGEAAAALASASILFRDKDPEYSARCLEHAKELFQFADSYRGKYSDSVPDAKTYYQSFTGYQDELAWAAAWLFKATKDTTYLSKAEKIYADHLASGEWMWTHSWDDKRYGTAVLLAQLTGGKKYLRDVSRWLDVWNTGGGGRKIQTTPGGLAWLDQWGSLRYAANTAFLAMIASRLESLPNASAYRKFAARQINYILGDNPQQRSYVVGIGNNPPQNPHHRGAHGSTTNNIMDPAQNAHVLTGALVGGPSAPDDSAYIDDRSNYITNEVALDYNAGFTGAVAGLIEAAIP